MKEQFCNYDISLRLKNLGFDEPCLAWHNLNALGKFGYWKQEKNIWKNSELHTGYITAPLFQQTIDWLRGEYDIHFSFHYNPRTKKYAMWIEGPKKILRNYSTEVDILYAPKFDTYSECREQSILKAIEILEENDNLQR